MDRHNEIKNAYRSLGKEATFYDGMITCSTLPGRVVCGIVWNMGMVSTPVPTGTSSSLPANPSGMPDRAFSR